MYYQKYLMLPDNITEYQNKLIEAAELGAIAALVYVGQIKPYLSRSEASRIYGSKIVRRWERDGLIHVIKDGPGTSKTRINRLELAAAAKVSNWG